jgi:hypothetical protein
MVEEWLGLASRQEGDYGWSLLYPKVRIDLIKSEDVYRTKVDAADWEAFAFAINSVQVEDGEYRVRLRLRGDATVPVFLVEYGLVQVRGLGLPNGGPLVVVRIDPSGNQNGIQATG